MEEEVLIAAGGGAALSSDTPHPLSTTTDNPIAATGVHMQFRGDANMLGVNRRKVSQQAATSVNNGNACTTRYTAIPSARSCPGKYE